MSALEALDYAIGRLAHEARVSPHLQIPAVLQRKLAAIETLSALRAQLAGQP